MNQRIFGNVSDSGEWKLHVIVTRERGFSACLQWPQKRPEWINPLSCRGYNSSEFRGCWAWRQRQPQQLDTVNNIWDTSGRINEDMTERMQRGQKCQQNYYFLVRRFSGHSETVQNSWTRPSFPEYLRSGWFSLTTANWILLVSTTPDVWRQTYGCCLSHVSPTEKANKTEAALCFT